MSTTVEFLIFPPELARPDHGHGERRGIQVRIARVMPCSFVVSIGDHEPSGMARRSPAAEQLTADSPLELRDRLHEALHRRGAATPWCTVLPELATTDWVAAAVISSSLGMRPPSLPTARQLGRQRSLRSLGNIELGVEWGYDLHELQMTFGSWVRILNGSARNIRRSYLYEGERCVADWRFRAGHALEVTYDDDGVGWEGELTALDSLSGATIDGVSLARPALEAAPGHRLAEPAG